MPTRSDDGDEGRPIPVRFLIALALFLVFAGLIWWVIVAFQIGATAAEVTGKVTYKNEALTGGEIRFVGASLTRSALIGADGTYTVPNCPLGEVKVAVFSSKASAAPPLVPGQKKTMKTQMAKPGSAIPVKYNRPETADLSYTIKTGTQKIDIELKD